jgi:hypothetical protein
MAEFKGTQGIWRIGILGNVQTEYGAFIAESEVNRATDEENKANNKLISCAPEMLEELQLILVKYDRGTDTYKRLELLIKKATE